QAHIVLVLGPLGARGRKAQPYMRGHMVCRHAETLVEHQAEQMLRGGIALLGAAPVPVGRERIVLRDTTTVLVHEAEIGLGARIAPFARGPDFLDRARKVTGPKCAMERSALRRNECRKRKRNANH